MKYVIIEMCVCVKEGAPKGIHKCYHISETVPCVCVQKRPLPSMFRSNGVKK